MARSNAAFAAVPVKYSTTRLGALATASGYIPGGLDQTTPTLSLQSGALRDCLNFECSQTGGYARIQGYERFDGRAAPSSADYIIVQFASFTTVPTVGATVVQDTTGATGTIVLVNNAAGAYYIVLSVTSGTFDYTSQVTASPAALVVTTILTVTTSLTVSNVVVGNAITPTVTLTPLLNAQYLALAADAYRALIGPVPGIGAVLGVVGMVFNNIDYVYAFRANVSNTAVDLYRSSTTGWQKVTLYNTVSFSACSALPADGDTITQGGVTALIKRVMWASGTTGASSAAGTLVVANPTGGNLMAGSATSSSGGVFTLAGAQTPITLKTGGHFEFVKCNFSGQLQTRRIYGCDGINKAFEFDGDTLAPITTGLSPDQPSHITYHKNLLFLSQASSIFYSAPGDPFKWSALDNAGEIAVSDIVTGFVTMPGNQTAAALSVFMQHNTGMLYGNDQSDFNYILYNQGAGAVPYSVQNLFDTFCLDHLGVVTLRTTLNFGNFISSALTKNILPFIQQERTKTIASCVMRDKSQYRVFFSDGYGLFLTIVNQDYIGATPVLFPNPVFCCDTGETSQGVEVNYFGSSDGLGNVYQMDSGTSFDGASIDAYVTLAWDAIKSPRVLKRYRAVSVEMQGSSYAAISFGYKLGYGTTNISQPTPLDYSSGFAAAPNWDSSFTWDGGFIWDGQTVSPTDISITGTAENIQVMIASTTNYIDAFTLDSVIYHYSERRGIRP